MGQPVLFDDLTGVVERHFPEFRPVLRDARIFRFESSDLAEDGPLEPDAGGRATAAWDADELLVENIRLPFTTIAIECCPTRESRGRCCVVLTRSNEPNLMSFITLQSGRTYANPTGSFGQEDRTTQLCTFGQFQPFPTGRFVMGSDGFLDVSSATDPMVRVRSMHAFDLRRKNVDTHWEVNLERLGAPSLDVAGKDDFVDPDLRACLQRLRAGENPYDPSISSDDADRFMRQVDAHKLRLQVEINESNANCALYSIMNALLKLFDINLPSSFIMEERPLATPPDPQKGKLARSPWRPHYIVLSPGEIRKRLLMPDPEVAHEPGSTRAPHERRGHFRVYRSERYKGVRGQKRWIEACWIGPREAVLGPNRYVVRTDL